MPRENIFWKNKKSVNIYHNEITKKSSGVIDDKFIRDYIKSKNKLKVVDLGIGSGRELSWLAKLENIKEIIGIDYSQDFLDICKEEAKKYRIKISLINDDLLFLKSFKRFLKEEKLPLIYICLINTLGNFKEKDRKKVLKNLKNLVENKDRLIFCLYKRPEKIRNKTSLPYQVKIKGNLEEEIKLGEAVEYASLEFFWPPILEKYHQLPRFWYDDKANDITIYVGKKKILISHRFSKEEIIELAKKTKFKIEKLIEGKFMWVVILKI